MVRFFGETQFSLVRFVLVRLVRSRDVDLSLGVSTVA